MPRKTRFQIKREYRNEARGAVRAACGRQKNITPDRSGGLQRKSDRLTVKAFEDVNEFPNGASAILFMRQQHAGEPLRAIERHPRKLSAVIVQETRGKANPAPRRAYLASLSMEEMAGNIVEHGFKKDNKRHSVDIRIVHKDDDVILRIKDDCVPFDPGERQKLTEGEDITKNIGIRMIFRIAADINYRNILGMNVLTIRV